MRKTTEMPAPDNLWNRFRTDDRSTIGGRWGLVVILAWLATQSLLACS
jgi:hypothetical protein